MSTLLLASNNQGKVIEIQALLQGLSLQLITPARLGLEMNVIEDGQTYAENAARKGLAFAKVSGFVTLADDSGLEVDALSGAPGLFSARFSPKPGANDADRRAYLLAQLDERPRPWTARFRCVIALATPGGDLKFAEGICPGEVIPEERGENGFGYDPIFWLPELGRTMAQLDLEEKNQLSHRACAVRAAIPLIRELFAPSAR
jgi:XTP/dITP diphosphohydrolase